MTTQAFQLLGDYTNTFSWFPEAASTFAELNDWLFGFISTVCLIFFVAIAYCLFYFAYKYQKPKGEPAESQVSHNTPLELAWSILPSILLIWMFYVGAKGYLDQRTPPEGAYQVGLNAKSWAWLMSYGRGTFHPELHIVVDEPTKLTMRSDDVIHSVFIPAFRVKKDVVPGRYNYMWFQPTVASEKVDEATLKKAQDLYKGQQWDYHRRWNVGGKEVQFTPDGYTFFDLYCTEYCGKDHSMMQTVVVVHKTRDDLNAWIKKHSSRGEIPMEEWGKRLYQQRGCQGCHSVDGSNRTGPTYKDAFGSVRELTTGQKVPIDENYVRESIIYPKAKIAKNYNPVMPSYKGQLSDDDIASIIEYMKTLSKNVKEEEPKKPAEDAAGEAASEDQAAEETESAKTESAETETAAADQAN